MKSLSLQRVISICGATAALRETLPGQESPWLLRDQDGDVIAYFNVSPGELDVHGPAIVADISGRHYDEDPKVLAVLKSIQEKVGGVIVPD
jgi:hypothetical protein